MARINPGMAMKPMRRSSLSKSLIVAINGRESGARFN
jgi:hypothetical protein